MPDKEPAALHSGGLFHCVDVSTLILMATSSPILIDSFATPRDDSGAAGGLIKRLLMEHSADSEIGVVQR